MQAADVGDPSCGASKASGTHASPYCHLSPRATLDNRPNSMQLTPQVQAAGCSTECMRGLNESSEKVKGVKEFELPGNREEQILRPHELRLTGPYPGRRVRASGAF